MAASKTVLLTGSTGFIGRATFLALELEGWQVTQGSRLLLENMPKGVVHLDLADPATALALAKGNRFDAIVHIGAHVGWSGHAESAMFAPNILSTGCLAYLANIWDAHIVYASAAIVHGVGAERIDCEAPICLDNAYAKSKWLGEQLIVASNARHCILRIAGVFGYAGPSHLGLNRAISMAIKGESPTQVGSGSALRSYVYVKDVALAVCYVLKHGLQGPHLLAGHEELSVSEMLKKVCQVLSPSINPFYMDGIEAKNQVVKPSTSLPKTRDFCEALIDIRNNLHS
jgi:nucleoside-diphosphate-sugar epimerase